MSHCDNHKADNTNGYGDNGIVSKNKTLFEKVQYKFNVKKRELFAFIYIKKIANENFVWDLLDKLKGIYNILVVKCQHYFKVYISSWIHVTFHVLCLEID